MKKTKYVTVGVAAGLAGLLIGCVAHVDAPPHHQVHVRPPPPVHVETQVIVRDDYVYYPSYQVYYSSTRRQYVYMEGRSWVTRPAPPRVSVDVLFASPSVTLDFHDAPAAHHNRVVQQYPKHWSPPGRDHDNGKGHGPDKGKGHPSDKGKGKGR